MSETTIMKTATYTANMQYYLTTII